MDQTDPALRRRTYLLLAGSAATGLSGCQSDGNPEDAPAEQSTPTETEPPRTTDSTTATGTTTEAPTAADEFPVPPDATESDLQFVSDMSQFMPGNGRNDKLTDLLFFVNAPDGVEPRGFEINSPKQARSWYDDNLENWTLESEEQVQVTGSFATDEMAPERGGGMRGRPNVIRRYRSGDRGALLWIRGARRQSGKPLYSLVVGTGTREEIEAVSIDYPKRPFDRENLPKFLTHNVCDLEYVDRVSRLRAGTGHSHTADFESCRTNKHYMEGFGVDNIPRYAPVSGTIHQIMQDGEIDVQTFLVPDEYPEFVVRQEHILLDDHIEVGTHVEGGDRLGIWNEAKGAGTTDHATAGEIIVHMRTPQGTALVSYFRLLTDDAFAEWIEHGGPDSREAYIIPKDVRDANPNTCGDDEFYETTVTVDGGDWAQLQE